MFDFDPLYMLLRIPGIVIGFAFYGFARAYAADKFGDKTPRFQGKLTIDPRAHIDLIGFILIALIGFGWGKPVQVEPRNFRNPKRDDILVSLAGPFMNLSIAIFFALILKIILMLGIEFPENIARSILLLFSATININVLLFVLNLLPFPFFDGYRILSHFVPVWRYRFFQILEQYSMPIFIVLVLTRVFSIIIGTPVSFIFISILNIFDLLKYFM